MDGVLVSQICPSVFWRDLPRVFDHDLEVSAYRVLGLEKVVVYRLFGAERCYMLEICPRGNNK